MSTVTQIEEAKVLHQKAIERMDKGAVTDPIASPVGMHIIRVDDVRQEERLGRDLPQRERDQERRGHRAAAPQRLHRAPRAGEGVNEGVAGHG